MSNTLVEVGNATINPLTHIWHNLVIYLPGLIGAIIVVVIGFLIGLLFGHIIKNLLVRWKLDNWVKKNDFSHILLNIKLSNLIGQLIKWGIFIAFLAPAAALIRLPELSSLITKFALWVPSVIFAIIITVFGLILAKMVSRNIHVSKDHKVSKVVSDIIQVTIIVLILDVALKQIGVQIGFIETIILIIVGGIVLALAIAIGIGFSGSVREYSKQILELVAPKKVKKK
ncbi:MAG: hypothetical protein WCY27_00410 [archaeon]|nr:hypothetical protein [archaeon]MDD2477640.1 hypothetical protein [Candidatus ainarchaeum sp.]MDD3085053.1 hypothetical protein [Candidatus ainarchaeum sp.]MDD4220821.1 hypothetical protein [Candidatus ainarchaeum sp.]MDD4662321.1 hypothetical protein [Candidatus ainarchaeum sp.]